jgi:hypothetical protein
MFSNEINISPRYQDLLLWRERESEPIYFKLTPREDGFLNVVLSLYIKANMLLVEEREFTIPVFSEILKGALR